MQAIQSNIASRNIASRLGLALVLTLVAACTAQRTELPKDQGISRQNETPPTSLAIDPIPSTSGNIIESKKEEPLTQANAKSAAPAAPIVSVVGRTSDKSPDKLKQNRIDQVVVTGSYIRGQAQDMPLPISVVSYSEHDLVASKQSVDTEKYDHVSGNPVHSVREQPVSTFSIDVDTGAYANVRRFLNSGHLPPKDAVRVEEMINYFDYAYEMPAARTTPFKVTTELAKTPWNDNSLLLKIGIKGFEIPASERPAANLVFLIDVSGSMDSADKLPLLKSAFSLLTDQLQARDRVSIVVYAGHTGVVLEPTPGDQKHKIHEALARLEAGGSTNGGAGITLAYKLAHDSFIKDGINRVVLATDGDFNVGTVNFEALINIAERERESGVAITTLGFGTGNYNDKLMERLADAGNGNYAYVDTLSEARKVLVSELSSTLFTIAKDVKLQVEFNPAQVQEYRLIGYENRILAREDFNNDKVDAGEIGAGHKVTALYEVILAGRRGLMDPLKYAALESFSRETSKEAKHASEIATVRVRYKRPDANVSNLLEYPVLKQSVVAAQATSADFRFAASVAAFGQLLTGGKYLGKFGCDDIVALANSAKGNDSEGYRQEFVSLVKLANSISGPHNERLSIISK